VRERVTCRTRGDRHLQGRAARLETPHGARTWRRGGARASAGQPVSIAPRAAIAVMTFRWRE